MHARAGTWSCTSARRSVNAQIVKKRFNEKIEEHRTNSGDHLHGLARQVLLASLGCKQPPSCTLFCLPQQRDSSFLKIAPVAS